MVKERMDLLGLLRKRGSDGDVDFLREALRVLVEGIMDAEVSAKIGAEYGERSPERVTQRNGYRSRAWDTRVGTMELRIPKLREGSYFPSLLEPRRRSERALLAVIQQAYVEGVSTRRVDDLVKALGCEGISKSQVSRICSELDGVVDSFLDRPLDGGPYRYLWLDALTQKVREAGRIVNVSVVVATAVNAEGRREIVGMDVGTSEDGAFWRSVADRGLSGVELVTSDAHRGLREAIATVFAEASWQRCRTHFMTNLLTRVPRRAQPWVATMVRTVYQQPSPEEVHAQVDRVLNSTTNGRSGVDTSRLHSLRSTKLCRRRLSLNQLPPEQHHQDDELLHHLTGRDPPFGHGRHDTRPGSGDREPGQLPGGPGEVPHLAGIDDDHRHRLGCQGSHQRALPSRPKPPATP